MTIFWTVEKMKQKGEACLHCADPNPYYYVLSKKLCGRCSISLTKKGVLPTASKKIGYPKTKSVAVKAFLNLEGEMSSEAKEQYETSNTHLHVPITKSIKSKSFQNRIGYLPPIKESSLPLSDESTDELETLFPDPPENHTSNSLDLHDLDEAEPLSYKNQQIPFATEFFSEYFPPPEKLPFSDFSSDKNQNIQIQASLKNFNTSAKKSHLVAINCLNPTCKNTDPKESQFYNGLCVSCYAFTEKTPEQEESEEIFRDLNEPLVDITQRAREKLHELSYSDWQPTMFDDIDFGFLSYLASTPHPICINENPNDTNSFVDINQHLFTIPPLLESIQESTLLKPIQANNFTLSFDEKSPSIPVISPTERPAKKLNRCAENGQSRKGPSKYRKQADSSIPRMHELGLKCINENCTDKNQRMFVLATNLCLNCNRYKKLKKSSSAL